MKEEILVSDLLIRCTVLYHFGATRFEEIISHISKNVSEVFLQANNGHTKDLLAVSNSGFSFNLLKKYGYDVEVYEADSVQPILYGKK